MIAAHETTAARRSLTRSRNGATGEPRYNAETLAGMREVDAMLAGEIPAKMFGSLDEMPSDLDSDD